MIGAISRQDLCRWKRVKHAKLNEMVMPTINRQLRLQNRPKGLLEIGKIHGCRVIGIAGTDEKCAWIVKDLGFDAAINYKHPDWKEKLAAATPNGIDIDFENVGGEIMQAVLGRMNLFGRVVVCGLKIGRAHV